MNTQKCDFILTPTLRRRKFETLHEAYRLAIANKRAPGFDGVSFDDVEQAGLTTFLNNIHAELVNGRYQPLVDISEITGRYRICPPDEFLHLGKF